jgi:hypothetical protein
MGGKAKSEAALIRLPKPRKSPPANAPAAAGAAGSSGAAGPVAAAGGPALDHILPALRPHAIRCADLVFDPVNPVKHGEKNLEAIKGSLQVFGQRTLLVFNARTRVVEKGNGTLAAALALGWEWIAAVPAEDSDAQASAYAIADNRSAQLAEWDNEALKARLQDCFTGSGEAKERMETMMGELAAKQKLWEEQQAAGGPAQAEKFQVVVECDSAEQQQSVFEELKQAGHACKLVTI